MSLKTALENLRSLSHDALTDLIDLMDYWNDVEGVHQRRKGKTPIAAIEAGAGRELRKAITGIRYLRKKNRAIVRDQAAMLRDALAPQEYRKRTVDGYILAQGTLQVKYIPRLKLNPDTGQLETVLHGPYLYLRVWATGGGRDRRQKRLKNK